MLEAVALHKVYKKFGNFTQPLGRRMMHAGRPAIANGVHPASLSHVIALDNISFTISQGEIFGVTGSGGSGKSTLIRLLATLLQPDSGNLRVFGHDVVRQPEQVRRLVNRVSVEASFFIKLSPLENLVHGASLDGTGGAEIRRQVVEILTRLGLEERTIDQPMVEMPRREQRKVAIAHALLSRPRLLLLDEPMIGLDACSKRSVKAALLALRQEQGTTILITTSDSAEIEDLCDRIAILDGGKMVALDTPQRMKAARREGDCASNLEDVFLTLTGKGLVKEEEYA